MASELKPGYHPPLVKIFLKDPTCLFTFSVVMVPLVFLGPLGIIQYLVFNPMLLLSVAFLAAVLQVTHSDGKSIPLDDRDQRVALWFLMNGVYFNLFLDVVSGQFGLMGEMSRQYLRVEPRYAHGVFTDSGSPVFMTSMCELFFQSPLCLITYYAYCRKKPYRYIAEFTVCVLHAAGVWWFYLPEIANNFSHLGGWPQSIGEALSFHRLLFFWFGFWFCMFLWLIVPFMIGKTAWIHITSAVEHLTQTDGAKKLN